MLGRVSFATRKHQAHPPLHRGGEESVTEESSLRGLVKSAVGVSGTEDLLIEAFRDLVKDEIKKHVRAKIDSNPELREEIKSAVKELVEAKVKESIALLKIAKAGAKLGLEMVPEEMRAQFMRDLVSMFEKEMGAIFEKGG